MGEEGVLTGVEMEAFMMRTQGVRHVGSAVLALCYVACGRVDALWEFGPGSGT
jgi:fructose-1,6-bisphosphatase/inositol monophosphatase family enzyme